MALQQDLPKPQVTDLAGPIFPQAFIVTVRMKRNQLGLMYAVGFGSQPILRGAPKSWEEPCPDGYSFINRKKDPDGFWLCARNQYLSKQFIIGNIIGQSDSGQMYLVKNESVAPMRSGKIGTCDGWTLLGSSAMGDEDGFWVCME